MVSKYRKKAEQSKKNRLNKITSHIPIPMEIEHNNPSNEQHPTSQDVRTFLSLNRFNIIIIIYLNHRVTTILTLMNQYIMRDRDWRCVACMLLTTLYKVKHSESSICLILPMFQHNKLRATLEEDSLIATQQEILKQRFLKARWRPGRLRWCG